MTALVFTRTGTGPPLVLLHGLGLSSRSWEPVIPALAERFDVVAIDLPGFGRSAMLPREVEPHPAALAGAVADLLDEIGIDAAHTVGNSLGGWVALELAQIRATLSVTLLSPAGLWRRNTPLYNRISLRVSRSASRRAPTLLSRLVDHRLGRVVVLSQTHARPAQMRPEAARAVISDLSNGPGFETVFRATARRRYLAGTGFDAPVTIAFGSKDRLLLRRQSRHLDQLPTDTTVFAADGCGHVPMNDDPAAVVAFIIASTAHRPGHSSVTTSAHATTPAVGRVQRTDIHDDELTNRTPQPTTSRQTAVRAPTTAP
ncbi:MAG: alpha/beta fold hydrolase [Ilumatobacteraceae bacterium]